MTFAAQETGHGYPIEIYEFKRGVSETFFLTSHDEPVTFQSNIYVPTQLERASVEQNTEIERAELKIKIQRDATILDNFVAYPPTEIMTLTIFRKHGNDVAEEFVTVWKGRVLTVEWSGSQATIACEPVFTSLKRPGLRRKFQSQCPHILYGAECALNNLAFQVIGTVSAISLNVVSAPEWIAGGFDGGYLVFESNQFRSVVADDGAGTLTLVSPFVGLEIGSLVEGFPGCAHDLTDCDVKFANVINYGGFPYVPGRNPFGGAILY